MRVTIDASRFASMTAGRLQKNLDAVGFFLDGKIKESISTGQETERYGRKAIYYRGHSPSSPGEPPHLLTGQLRASITHQVTDDLRLRIGSNLDYSLILEQGSQHMAARPFLRPAIIAHKDAIVKIAAR